MRGFRRFLFALTLAFALPASASAACGDTGVALQVLGSGGPIANDKRASSGYLLWINGRAVALIDAGGGVFQRYGAAGARLQDLQLIALTHFHADHASDVPALLKARSFLEQPGELVVSGPDGLDQFPPLETFLDRLVGADNGAFAYLSGLLGVATLKPVTIEHQSVDPRPVFSRNGVSVEAVGVHHGPVPTLGYLIRIGDSTTIAISGDQNLDTDYFTDMIRGADLLVMPTAVAQTRERSSLHARPSDIGKAADAAGVGKLVLSHWMPASLANQTANVKLINKFYNGPVVPASDMQCLPVD